VARTVPEQDEDIPVLDPTVIQRNYRRERARRRARIERRRETQYAHLRFWVVLAGLVFLVVFLGLTVWHQVQQLFGL
jgi:hypothetical protein